MTIFFLHHRPLGRLFEVLSRASFRSNPNGMHWPPRRGGSAGVCYPLLDRGHGLIGDDTKPSKPGRQGV